MSETRGYNAYGEEASYTVTAGGSTLYAVTYDTTAAPRDGLGRIQTKTETIAGSTTSTSYGYDGFGRLADVKVNGVLVRHYEYDANGNRMVGPGAGTPVYDAQDRMLHYGLCDYTYKGSGELLTKTCSGDPAPTTYDYDGVGNLRNVKLPNGTHIEYLIDGQNRRIGKRSCGSAIEVSCPVGSPGEGFVYRNQLQVAAWLDSDGSVKATFVYGLHANVPEYMVVPAGKANAGTYRLVVDQVGTLRLVVDVATGAVVERTDLDEFGKVPDGGYTTRMTPFGFAGGLWERASGFTRFGMRDYEPTAGRWTDKDRLRFGGGGPSFYNYVSGDPLNYFDPAGAEKIPTCVQRFLAPQFPGLDLKRIDIDVRTLTPAERNMAGDDDVAAYTIGYEITFDSGQYDPYSAAGVALLAHEVEHVYQFAFVDIDLQSKNIEFLRREGYANSPEEVRWSYFWSPVEVDARVKASKVRRNWNRSKRQCKAPVRKAKP